MISPEKLYNQFINKGISFFTGVPDSILKDFLFCLSKHHGKVQHSIAANEGQAIALASGYHLATGKIPLVYMQNSGLGNAVNPLTSLADPDVYSIPMVLLIGWRGKPGEKDEPQHRKMGRITEDLLKLLRIQYFIVDREDENFAVEASIDTALKLSQPVALLISPGSIENEIKTASESKYSLTRESVINSLCKIFDDETVVICTTGKTGREFDELNRKNHQPVRQFLCIGAMGLASQVALGIHMNYKGRTVVLDGDGALLMHLGAMTTIGSKSKGSFVHILLNNGSHESVGGHSTVGFFVDFPAIAKACGYAETFLITTQEEFDFWIDNNSRTPVLQFVEIRIKPGSKKNLGRPTGNPVQWKEELMEQLTQNR